MKGRKLSATKSEMIGFVELLLPEFVKILPLLNIVGLVSSVARIGILDDVMVTADTGFAAVVRESYSCET